ncbi:MAG TPA: AAA family ATPase [Methanomicrobia archaeon]|nr:AAA family ATPase [Methanomicrobia archaeon]
MWTEDYRPKRLDELIGHDEVVKRLQGFVKEQTVPNLLLWGPPGSGKTSVVYALSQELYGEFYRENLMHIETADFVEGGKRWLKETKRFKFFYNEQKSAIVMFKDMLREYAALAPINASFKLLYFSNADLLPWNVQHALRRIMERSNRTCRFIFATTKPASIIPAIRSRCLNLHFRSLAQTGALDQLLGVVAQREGITLTAEGLAALGDYARGDARTALLILEAATARAGPEPPVIIDATRIAAVAANVFFQRQQAEGLLESALRGRYRDVRARLEFLMRVERVGGRELLLELHEAVRRKMQREMTPEDRDRYARVIVHEAEADLKLCTALHPLIPLDELLATIAFRD